MPLRSDPKPDLIHEDGSLWEASWEVDENGNDLWYIGLADKSRRYCFRQLRRIADEVPEKPKWWQIFKSVSPPRERYERTGKVYVGGEVCKAGFMPIMVSDMLEGWIDSINHVTG